MAKGITLLDKNNNIVYPRTILEQVYNKEGTNRLDNILRLLQTNIESDIADTNLAVAQLREELDAFLSDATVSGEVRDAIIEIKNLLDSNSSDVVGELVATMAALRDEAVRNVAQTLTETQKSTARANIGAVGVSATYGDGLATLSYGGNAIFPETKGNQVKLSIGGNAEDAIKANGENIEKERVRAIAREDEIAETLAETKEKVDAFLVDADTSEQAIDKLKELQDYIKSDETSASQMLGEIAQNKQDIADNATNIDKEAARAKQTEMYLESQKANKSGYYENLSVGIADNLSGRGEATESEFSFRPSGGENKSIEDGTARINTIKGNSVVYNQCAKDPLFETENNSNWLYRGYSSYNVSNGTVEIISGGNDECYIDQFFNFAKEHVYLFICDVKGGGRQSGIRAYYEGISRAQYANVNELNKWERLHVFVKSSIEESGSSRIRLYCTDSGNVTSYFRKPRLIDLTKIFGAGNEPTTVEEFEALYGNTPNEYNEGTIIDNHTSAIKSVGVNAWDEEYELGWIDNTGANRVNSAYIRSKNYIQVLKNSIYRIEILGNNNTDGLYYLYDENKNIIASGGYGVNGNNLEREFATGNASYIRFYINESRGTYMRNICIHLVHTGYLNGKYFPYESQTRQLPTVEGGLKSAGTAYDEIRYNKGKDKWEHIQRVGSVDLGTLEWKFLSGTETSNNRFATLSGLDNAKSPAYGERPNVLCSKYKRISPYEFYEVLSADLGVGISRESAQVILLDKRYNDDVVALKSSLQGVILNYELAEPIITELNVDISPDYKVWDYGTEEAISEVLSTPVRINANYGFNAVGQIIDNTVLIQELLARVAVLEAQVAQANSANIEPIEPVVE